jgi:hypothetical protein
MEGRWAKPKRLLYCLHMGYMIGLLSSWSHSPWEQYGWWWISCLGGVLVWGKKKEETSWSCFMSRLFHSYTSQNIFSSKIEGNWALYTVIYFVSKLLSGIQGVICIVYYDQNDYFCHVNCYLSLGCITIITMCFEI